MRARALVRLTGRSVAPDDTLSYPHMKRLFTLALLLLSAIGGQAAPLPDFALPDVNASVLAGTTTNASPRRGQSVSPKDYKGRILVVYFGKEG